MRPLFTCILLTGLLSLKLTAQPVNDLCANAVAIPANGPFPYLAAAINVTGVTNTGDPVVSCGSTNKGVWYAFTPSVTDTFAISTCNSETGGTIFNTDLAVFSSANGCVGPLIPVACAASGCDNGTLNGRINAVQLDANQSYYFFVAIVSVINVNTNSLGLLVDFAPNGAMPLNAPPPANDICSGAINIPGAGPFPYVSPIVDVTTATKTGDANLCSGAAAAYGIWYTFTPAVTDTFTLSTCGDETGTNVKSTALEILTSANGCAGPFTAVRCIGNGCGPSYDQAKIDGVILTGGITYYIMLHQLSNVLPSPGKSRQQLKISRTYPLAGTPPPNDLCQNAVVIPANGPFPHLTPVISDISFATLVGDPVPPYGGSSIYASRSIWYSFSPAASGNYSIKGCNNYTASSLNSMILAVYTSANGCNGPFTMLTFRSNGHPEGPCYQSDQPELVSYYLSAGTTYYFLIFAHFMIDSPPATAVQLLIEKHTPPLNDEVTGAIALQLNIPYEGSARYATNNYQYPGWSKFSGVGQLALNNVVGADTVFAGCDVVFSFTAPAAGLYNFRLNVPYPEPIVSPFMALYACSSLPAGPGPHTVRNLCIKGVNRTFDHEELDFIPMAQGQTIYLIVDNKPLGNVVGGEFVLTASQCRLETEPNNSFAQAQVLAMPMADPVTFTLSGPGDYDYFSFQNPYPNGRLFAMVEAGASALSTVQMRITDAANVYEYDYLNNDPWFGYAAPQVAGTPLPSAGAYSIQLSINLAFSSGEPFHLFANVQPPSEQAILETEPNQNIVTANHHASGYYRGQLSGPSPSADQDIYMIQGQAGQWLFAGLDGDPLRDNTPLNAMLELLDAQGNVLMLANDNQVTTANNSYTPGNLFATTPSTISEGLLWHFRTTGIYYVRVSVSPNANVALGSGDYLLSLALIGEQAPQTLPAEGLSLQGRLLPAQRVELVWSVDRELNTRSYEVERSHEGVAFESIGSVSAQGGEALRYRFEDLQPASGSNFYRLRVLDHDGSHSYSQLIEVRVNDLPDYGLYPNPLPPGKALYLRGEAGQVLSLHLYDLTGRSLKSFSAMAGQPLYLSGIPAGWYSYQLRNRDGLLLAIDKLAVSP